MAIYPKATFIQTPNYGYPVGTKGQVKPVAKVYHCSGGGTLAGQDNWFRNPDSQASAHFGIDQDGNVHQYADTLDACWHAGKLDHPDVSVPLIKYWNDNNINPNRWTIGIEHIMAPEDHPSEQMIQASIELSKWLDEQHPTLGDTINEHIRHSQIDSVNRAHDPGPNFPLDRIVEEHHMALTDEQKRDLVVAALTSNLIDLQAIASRIDLRVLAAMELVKKYKSDGSGLADLKKSLADLKSQQDYISFVQTISSIENQLTFLGV